VHINIGAPSGITSAASREARHSHPSPPQPHRARPHHVNPHPSELQGGHETLRAARPRTWAEIDLAALEHNLSAVRRVAGEGRELILVVKADAYGHGAAAIASHAARLGVGRFGVGTVDEALELQSLGLRAKGVPVRSLVLGTVVDAEVPAAVRHGIELGVHTLDRCRQLAEMARANAQPARVHLNVDTGMGRLGVLPERALELLAFIAAEPGLELVGLMTHLAACSLDQREAGRRQLQRFDRVVQSARAAGHHPACVHVGNSAAVFGGLRPLHDAIRPGIAAYGLLDPKAIDPRWGSPELVPVLSLKSQVVFFKDLPAGSPIGYDGTYVLARPSRVGTLPLGYHDGVPWRVSGRGYVLIDGRRAPILGRISMDYTTVDLTDLPGVRIGDEAVIIGRSGDQRLSALDLAQWAGTIPYEVTCSVGRRVQRRIVGGPDS
jgi:alanine racemase